MRLSWYFRNYFFRPRSYSFVNGEECLSIRISNWELEITCVYEMVDAKIRLLEPNGNLSEEECEKTNRILSSICGDILSKNVKLKRINAVVKNISKH